MASENEPVRQQFYEGGIYKFFNFAEEELKKFTIDPNASSMCRKDQWKNLQELPMHGSCKLCKYSSAQKPKNASNWVRHLKVSLQINSCNRFLITQLL